MCLFTAASTTMYAGEEKATDDSNEEYYIMGNACAFLGAVMVPMTQVQGSSLQKFLIYTQVALFTVGAGWAWYKGEQHADTAKDPSENRRNAVLSTVSGFALGTLISKVAKQYPLKAV